MIKKIIDKFDKNRFKQSFKFVIIFLCLVVIFNVLKGTYSRYESSVNVYSDAKVAYFIVDQKEVSESIILDDLEPRDEPYIYTINVYNHDDNKRCDVDLEYKVSLKTTTNLPLTYKIIKNETYSASATDIISNREYITDDDGMYYNKMTSNVTSTFTHNTDQMDQYSIIIFFPSEYKNNSELYQGKIDLITFIISATQLV